MSSSGLGGSFKRGNKSDFGSGRRPVTDIVNFRVVPIALDRDGICAAQQAAGAGYLTINGVRASGGTVALDCSRAVTIYSAGNLSALTFRVEGTDYYSGAFMREDVTGPNNSTVATDKAFGTIRRIYVSGAVASDVEVGWNDKIGLPVRVRNASDLFVANWNGAADSGATLAVADDTSPATATTNDVRGTYTPGSVANGTKVLHLLLGCDPDTQITLRGQPQYAAGVV